MSPPADPLELELRRQIVADPDSDELRLVYADYWEDARDLERAEFIRVSIEAARADSYPERLALEIRRDHLLAQNRERWIPRVPWGVGFRRGMIGSITISDASYLTADLPDLADHPIELLDLYPTRPLLPYLTAFPGLDRIRELGLSGAAPGELEMLGRAELPALRHLTFSGDVGLLVAELTLALEGLTVTCTDADQLAPALAAANLAGLRSLDVCVASLGPTIIDALCQLESLRELSVDDSPEVLRCAPLMERLTCLELSGPTPTQKLAAPALERLTLAELERGDRALIAICEGEAPALRWLDLAGADHFDEPALAALAESPLVDRLEHLDLSVSDLDDRALGALGRGRAPHLAYLDLSSNNFGDDGLGVLADAGFLEPVVWLDVGDNAITDASVSRLLEGAPALRLLDILHADVSPDLIARLEERAIVRI